MIPTNPNDIVRTAFHKNPRNGGLFRFGGIYESAPRTGHERGPRPRGTRRFVEECREEDYGVFIDAAAPADIPRG
jgi:hypothetical protein